MCGRSTNHEPGSLSYSTWIGRHCERDKASCYTNFLKEITLSIKIILTFKTYYIKTNFLCVYVFRFHLNVWILSRSSAAEGLLSLSC